MTSGARRGLLLDRDGTIIPDRGYPRDPDAVELLPGAASALRTAAELGFALVIVSNQSGVARGIIQPAEARAVQSRVEALFAKEGVTFERAYFCFHGPDERCACRKPSPGMLLDAQADLGLDLARSIMVGDKSSDIEAGLAAGCTTVAFGGLDEPRAAASFLAWDDVVPWLREQLRSRG